MYCFVKGPLLNLFVFVMNYSILLLLVLAVGVLSACADSEDAITTTATQTFQQDPAERDSVLAYLRQATDLETRRGFRYLSELDFTRTVRTELLNPQSMSDAYRESRIRITSGEPRLLGTDSSGTFDLGEWDGTAHAMYDSALPENPVPYIVPEDPAYLAPRNRDVFIYKFLPDTTFGNTTAHVVEIHAIPEHEQQPTIRRARLYYKASNEQLIGLALWRQNSGFLFQEDSHLELMMQKAPTGVWVPHITTVRTQLKTFLRPTRALRTTNTYTDLALSN